MIKSIKSINAIKLLKVFCGFQRKRFFAHVIEDWDDTIKANLGSIWDPNWDKKDVDLVGYNFLWSKRIVLVGAAQYDRKEADRQGRIITKTGKLQAKKTAERLMKFGRFKSCVYANNQESTDTAEIIKNFMGTVYKKKEEMPPFIRSEVLENCRPVKSSPLLYEETPRQYYVTNALSESGFRKIFYRSEPPKEGEAEDNVLIICNRYLIAYFLVRALQFPCETWSRFKISDSSISTFKISSNGDLFATAISDLSHIPPKLLS